MLFSDPGIQTTKKYIPTKSNFFYKYVMIRSNQHQQYGALKYDETENVVTSMGTSDKTI